MATYISVPLKKTWEVDLEKPLRNFISNTYNDANPEDYNPAITEFQKLRANVISKWADKHESALEVVYRYYDQLVAIEPKFPISENELRINFKWQDTFGKESFFSGKRTLSISSAGYEKVCVLFNVAALQTQVAEAQNTQSDDGLKTAAKLFQQASGIFTHLKECVMSHVQSDPTPDLHPDTLGAIAALMLAQGQDCFCQKAMQDRMKPQIVAKLCHQASDFYAEAMKLLQLDSLRSLWPKDWLPTSVSKQASFHALAEFYQSEISRDSKDFGEQISRLKHAKQLMDAAEMRGGYTFSFQSQQKTIDRNLAEAEKDNSFIYHAKIPDISTLPPVGKHAIAKQIPLSEPMSTNFKDLFEKVVPLAVHQALSGYEARKGELVNREVGRLRDATQHANSVLAAMNLPAAIEDLAGTSVPNSVLEKAARMREMGGHTMIHGLMNSLPELLTRNKEILDESDRALNEEENSDKTLREQFKERWTRTPSHQLTGQIRQEAQKYRGIIDNAIQADVIVKKKFAESKESIMILSEPDAKIAQTLPSASPAAALKDSPVIQQLRNLLEQVETLKAEREVMENELKETPSDITSKMMTALAQDGAINELSMSEAELERIYGPLQAQVSDSIHRQETILVNIERVNIEFVQAKSQNQAGVQREQKLKDFAVAYDTFTELKGNLEEGTKFYNDLTQLLVKFQSKVNDFCFARRTEKEELLKDLQSAIAKQPSVPPPRPPAYQAPQSGEGQTPQPPKRPPRSCDRKKSPARPKPPARPPPPNTQACAAAPVQAAAPPAAPQPAAAPAYGYPPQTAPSAAPTGYPPQPSAAPTAASYRPPYNYPQGAAPYPTYTNPYPAYVPPPMPQGAYYTPYGQQGGQLPYPPQAPQPGQQAYPAQQPYPGYNYPAQQPYR